MATVIIGEAKTLKFVIKDGDGVARDCTGATFKLFVKENISDTTYQIEKSDSDFNKTNAATGIIRLPLSSSDIDKDPKTYFAELETTFSATSIDKFAFYLVITPTVE